LKGRDRATRGGTVAHVSAPDLSPYLFYSDVDRAARFLQDAFGFSLGFTSREPDGRLAHAQLLHGTRVVMLGHAGEGGLGLAKSAQSFGGPLHAGVYVFVDDVDAHCARAAEAGAKVVLPPADQPWGDRMYCALDVEGQFWMFANGRK
jgi:uncharacterized glyoxalase superfamily protein PhnB